MIGSTPPNYNTLQDIFMWIIILGIGIMGERKYGDFFQESPNFVPQIKLSHFHAKLFQRNQNHDQDPFV